MSVNIRNRSSAAKLHTRQAKLRHLLDERQLQIAAERSRASSWAGFRKFEVIRLVEEAQNTTSVYLAPRDGKPIPDFLPGQHLTLRFPIAGQSKPVIRCYSLSDCWRPDHYRITVKQCLAPRGADVPPGLVSSFVNHHLQQGDVLDVKAPAGHFCLDLPPARPIVMLAGGIGITPMISMINRELGRQSGRQMLLVVAVNDSSQHAFRSYLADVKRADNALSVLTCYSNPRPGDQLGQDFDYPGRVNMDLLQKILPHKEFDFFMCGPPPFMTSMYQGLVDWGVADERIHFESFGPASVRRVGHSDERAAASNQSRLKYRVAFRGSNKTLEWDGTEDNLLDFAETHGIVMESGCRAGNCGACRIAVAGQVSQAENTATEPGTCLACVSQPTGDIELQA